MITDEDIGISMSGIEPPLTVIQDRHYLKMSISEYKNFAEAVSSFCYLNKEGNHCKIRNAQTKKLKNLKYGIKKSNFLMKSLIWKEQLRLLEVELSKRQRLVQRDYS
jgi:hypothetical protein